MISKDSLLKLGADNLSDIIMDISNGDDEIKKQVHIKLASFDESPKKLVSLIKKDISSIKRSNKFYDYKT